MARREIQVFNMSFLDMMTNFLGAVIILFLLAAQNVTKLPEGSRTKIKVEGSLDPERLLIHARAAGVAVGDTLMLIIADGNRLPSPAGGNSGGIAGGGKKRDYVDTTGLWRLNLIPEQQPEALYITDLATTACDDPNTPEDPDDDRFSVQIKVEKTGKPSGYCLIDGRNYPYKSTITLGPFLIKNGQRTVTVRDAQNLALIKSQVVNPPQPCSEQPGNNQPPPPPMTAPPAPGAINFYASWDDPDDLVNIYVEKDGDWVYGGRRRDKNIGDWTEYSSGGWPRRKNTNVETVRQSERPIPGTYRVYVHYRGHKNQEKTKQKVPVTIWFLNQKFPGENKPAIEQVAASDNNPRRGGGKLIKTIQITADGHFIIK